METIKMPRLGITMQEGTIGKWLKTAGEYVETGEAIFELQTEKSVVEVESQGSGILHIIVEEGQEVPINTVVGALTAEGEDIDLSQFQPTSDENTDTSNPPDAAGKSDNQAEDRNAEDKNTHNGTSQNRKVRVLPKIRKLARDLNVNLADIQGTGPKGDITEDDVRQAATGSSDHIERTEVLSGLKKSMAENMTLSWSSIPQFTQMIEVNASNLKQYRENAKQVNENYTYTDLVVRAIVKALENHPQINSSLNGNKVLYYRNVNIGVAVATNSGLVVPVVRDLQECSLPQIKEQIQYTLHKAHEGYLQPEDYRGASITVSNLGMYGIESGTPILNPGNSCLVFIGALSDKAVVEDGEIVVRPVLGLSFTYDHRIIDGVQGAQFTNEVRQSLENFS